MSHAVQKGVRGLPDLLGEYQGGGFDLFASPWATGTYDITDFLSEPRFDAVGGTINAVGPVLITVPQNELWLLHFASIFATSVGATTAKYYLGFQSSETPTQLLYGLTSDYLGAADVPAGETTSVGWTGRMTLLPGDIIGAQFTVFSGVGVAYNLGVRYNRIRV